MGITIRHDAVGIPLGENPNQKYGQALTLQQRKYDMDTRQQQQGQQFDLQRTANQQAYMTQRDYQNDIAKAIENGEFDPDTSRRLRTEMANYSEVMTNPRIDATQREQARVAAMARQIPLLSRRMDPTVTPTATDRMNERIAIQEDGSKFLEKSSGDYEPLPSEPIPASNVAMGSPSPSQQGRKSAIDEFRRNPKEEDKWLSIVDKEAMEEGKKLSVRQRLERAAELFEERQEFYYGPKPKPVAAPVKSNDGQTSPVRKRKPYIFLKPKGRSVTQLGDGYVPPQVNGGAVTDNAVPLSPTGNPMTADTQYDMQNLGRTPGTNFFDPNNPAHAAMRAPQMQQPQQPSQYAGEYGLGGVNFGTNARTGNNVSASVRPGGTMIQYDEPVKVHPPINVGPGPNMVSPGEAIDPAYLALPESPKPMGVKDAELVAGNSESTLEQKQRAARVLADAGYSVAQVAAMEARSRASGSGSFDVSKEPPMGREAMETPRANRPAAKPKPGVRPSSKDIEEMLGYLQSGNPSDAEKEVIEGILRDEGVSIGATPASTPLQQLQQADMESGGKKAGSVTSNPGKLRTWTSADGRKFDGTIVDASKLATQRVLTVKRKDGKVFEISIDQLGEDDKAYLDAVYKIGLGASWTDRTDSRTSKGESYQYDPNDSLRSPAGKPPVSGAKPPLKGKYRQSHPNIAPSPSSAAKRRTS